MKLKLLIFILTAGALILANVIYKTSDNVTGLNSVIHLQNDSEFKDEKNNIEISLDKEKSALHEQEKHELTIADFEHENLTTPSGVIKLKLADIDQRIELNKLVEKANSGQLDFHGIQILRESIRLKSALHKILIDRRIKNLKREI